MLTFINQLLLGTVRSNSPSDDIRSSRRSPLMISARYRKEQSVHITADQTCHSCSTRGQFTFCWIKHVRKLFGKVQHWKKTTANISALELLTILNRI